MKTPAGSESTENVDEIVQDHENFGITDETEDDFYMDWTWTWTDLDSADLDSANLDSTDLDSTDLDSTTSSNDQDAVLNEQQTKVDPSKISVEIDQAEFECNVCLEVPKSSPIFQCQDGHLFCNDCHPKLSQCPVCRNGTPMGNIKSLIATKILEVPRRFKFLTYD